MQPRGSDVAGVGVEPPERVQPEDQPREPLSRKVKLLTAAGIFYGNIGLALVCHVHGPALTSFQNKYGTDDETISIVFSLMTAGISTGALLSALLFRYVNRQLAITCFFGGMGVCMFLIPHAPNLTLFFILSGLMGLCGGFYSSAQFTWILEMMQSECPPYVIAQHFFYAFGIILASLLMAPFLEKRDDSGALPGPPLDPRAGPGLGIYLYFGGTLTTSEESHDVISNSTRLWKEGDSAETGSPGQSGGDTLVIPFTIMALLLELAMIFHLILYIFFRYHASPPEAQVSGKTEGNAECVETGEGVSVHHKGTPLGRHEDDDESNSSDTVPIVPRSDSCRDEFCWRRLLLITYLGVFCGSFKGMEDNVVAFLPKYAQNSPQLHMSESESAYLLSASMLSYTISRFLGIFLVHKVPPRAVLCVNMLLTLASNVLLITAAQSSLSVVWLTAVLFGVGFSTAYGCFSAYLERYLRVTDCVGAFVLVYGAGVAATYPLLIGVYIDKHPVILGYTAFISIAICSSIFVASSAQTWLDKKRH